MSEVLGTVVVPNGQSGNWRVEDIEVSEAQARFSQMRPMAAVYGVEAGTYKRLVRGNTIVMSNTQMEILTNREFVRRAKGRCLINGLGLGMVLTAILAKPEVTEVIVVEKSADVIALVAPHFIDNRVTIIHADALEYQPKKGVRFNAVWHDIWDTICADNLEDMKLLHRRYGKRCDWQGSWSRELIRHDY